MGDACRDCCRRLLLRTVNGCRLAPTGLTSAYTRAPLACAWLMDSSTRTPAPSPITKPSRASSKGRDAEVGSLFPEVDRAFSLPKPARLMASTQDSVPPATCGPVDRHSSCRGAVPVRSGMWRRERHHDAKDQIGAYLAFTHTGGCTQMLCSDQASLCKAISLVAACACLEMRGGLCSLMLDSAYQYQGAATQKSRLKQACASYTSLRHSAYGRPSGVHTATCQP